MTVDAFRLSSSSAATAEVWRSQQVARVILLHAFERLWQCQGLARCALCAFYPGLKCPGKFEQDGVTHAQPRAVEGYYRTGNTTAVQCEVPSSSNPSTVYCLGKDQGSIGIQCALISLCMHERCSFLMGRACAAAGRIIARKAQSAHVAAEASSTNVPTIPRATFVGNARKTCLHMALPLFFCSGASARNRENHSMSYR